MGYIYQAEVYCGACGQAIRDSLKDSAPQDALDHHSYDSDDYPKDADVEHDESDCPEHCGACGKFLQNPLTSYGYKYVGQALKDLPALTSLAMLRDGGHEFLAEWANWYGFTYWSSEDCAEDGRHTEAGWYSDEAF